MATAVDSPEWLILSRTLATIKTMAAEREFVRSSGEAVRSIGPSQVRPWITPQGARYNSNDGTVNIPLPSILVSPYPVKGANSSGTNCADDEMVQMVIQICDTAIMPAASRGPIRTYMDWMNRIRSRILNDLTLFRQDFDPAVADPFAVKAKDRVPADPDRLTIHDQKVAVFSFVVFVRHTISGSLS